MKKLPQLLLVILVGALLDFSLSAGTIIHDDFDYADGPLVVVAGTNWIHHSPSGSATGEVAIISGRVRLDQRNSEDVHIALPGGPYRTNSVVKLQVGFTLNVHELPVSSGGYFGHFGHALFEPHRPRIFVTTNDALPGAFRIGIDPIGSRLQFDPTPDIV